MQLKQCTENYYMKKVTNILSYRNRIKYLDAVVSKCHLKLTERFTMKPEVKRHPKEVLKQVVLVLEIRRKDKLNNVIAIKSHMRSNNN